MIRRLGNAQYEKVITKTVWQKFWKLFKAKRFVLSETTKAAYSLRVYPERGRRGLKKAFEIVREKTGCIT